MSTPTQITARTATTESKTRTATIESEDVCDVMMALSTEMTTLMHAAKHVACDFDAASAERDCGLLALYSVISGLRLQFYLHDELVREYRYLLRHDGSLTASGPAADQPPTGYIPEGTRVRLLAVPNEGATQEHRDHWFSLLGWTSAKPLAVPATAVAHTYGTFVSGNFGAVRQLLANPKYDRPVAPTTTFQKGGAQ
ncbi:MAG: hypothetical protein JWN14_1526 [Chthonomonadales bacterium]|nr:hypothetical protein [Chthonomonadales bacterium]